MKPNWLVLLEHVVAAAVVAALVTGFFWWFSRGDWRITALGFVISLPVVARLLARPVIEIFSEGFGWLTRQPLAGWEGGYYAFDGQHIRVYTHEGELWFVARDLIEAAGIRELPQALLATQRAHCRRIPGTRHVGLDAVGVEKLLSRHAPRHPDAGRLLLWVQREVLHPWERKRGAPLNEPAAGYRRSAE